MFWCQRCLCLLRFQDWCGNVSDSPFMTIIHSMVHHCNLAIQTLSNMSHIVKIEALFASMYMYFSHSPKRHLEHTKLVEIMETKSFKKNCNVMTWWVSMLAPSKFVLFKYKLFVVKMKPENASNALAKINYELLCDHDTILGLTCFSTIPKLV